MKVEHAPGADPTITDEVVEQVTEAIRCMRRRTILYATFANLVAHMEDPEAVLRALEGDVTRIMAGNGRMGRA